MRFMVFDLPAHGGRFSERLNALKPLVDALNLLGVTPSDLVAILEALKEAGALKAEIEQLRAILFRIESNRPFLFVEGLQVRPARQLLLSPWLLAIPIAVLEE